ncbi:MAG: DUF3737 family protein [Clostridiales bacterium]|nr:DUF3737 family protein [Clostridiales bacterium]
MEIIKDGFFEGERALFFGKDLQIANSVFDNGESPLKHSNNIDLQHVTFKWKYPIWYSNHIRVKESVLTETARAGIWYTTDLLMENVKIDAPKTFRRSSDLILRNVDFTNAQETLWSCRNVKMEKVTAKGDYFAMNSSDLQISNLELIGNYGFDGGENIEISDSKLITKDAFWNCRNVTVKNSYISGEYFGWNSENIVLENCTIESLQGMCYIHGLTMKNCKLINTTLSFEYSDVDATIEGHIDSVKNPSSGRISAASIGELIMEEDRVDTSATTIETEDNDAIRF